MENRFFKMSEVAKEDPKQALKTMFCNTDLSSASIWVVKPGQEVKTHKHPNSDDIWIVIEGEGDFHPEVGKDVHVSAGTVIYNKKGECHGITNNTDKDLKFIGVIAPHPAEYVALP